MSTASTAQAQTTPAPSSVPPNKETIKLLVPITIAGQEVTELSVRRPKVSDRMAIDSRTDLSDAQKELAIFGLIVGLAPSEMEQIDLADYGQIQDKYRDFVQARPAKPSASKPS